MIVAMLSQQALDIHARLHAIELRLAALQHSDEVARRLSTIPGIGPVGATALAASVSDPHQFRSGRQFAAWLGLTPLQKSSGGKERLGRISKMGDKYLRRSEEHTSELQSLMRISYAVLCLKKKKPQHHTNTTSTRAILV